MRGFDLGIFFSGELVSALSLGIWSLPLWRREGYTSTIFFGSKETGMRSGWVNSSFQSDEILIWYDFLHDCVVYIHFCGSFTLLSNPERCWGFSCLRYRVRFRPRSGGDVHSERLHSREIYKWNILLEVLGNGEQIKKFAYRFVVLYFSAFLLRNLLCMTVTTYGLEGKDTGRFRLMKSIPFHPLTKL